MRHYIYLRSSLIKKCIIVFYIHVWYVTLKCILHHWKKKKIRSTFSYLRRICMITHSHLCILTLISSVNLGPHKVNVLVAGRLVAAIHFIYFLYWPKIKSTYKYILNVLNMPYISIGDVQKSILDDSFEIINQKRKMPYEPVTGHS